MKFAILFALVLSSGCSEEVDGVFHESRGGGPRLDAGPDTIVETFSIQIEAAAARAPDPSVYSNPPRFDGGSWDMTSIRPLRYPVQLQVNDKILGWRVFVYKGATSDIRGQLQRHYAVNHFHEDVGPQENVNLAGLVALEVFGINEYVSSATGYSIQLLSTGQPGDRALNAEVMISRERTSN